MGTRLAADPRPTPARVVGDGPIRLLVSHGWMGASALFAPSLPFLDPAAVTAALLDSRGYGGRQNESGPMSIEAVAQDLLALADGLAWDRFHVVGHSMGGMAAQHLMATHPERLRSAILVAPVPASGARIDAARRSTLLSAINSPEARRDLIDLNTGRRLPAPMLDQILSCSLASTRPDAMRAYLDSWTGPGFEDEVRGSTVPVLTLAGELDPGAPAERLRATILRWFPRAELRVMAGVGHYPMQENPRAFAAALAGWCAALPA